MEEHLDKILYLVLMLITLIAGVFSKSKKRNMETEDPFPLEEYETVPTEEKTLKDDFNELGNMKDEIIEKREKEYDEDKYKKYITENREKEYDENKYKKYISEKKEEVIQNVTEKEDLKKKELTTENTGDIYQDEIKEYNYDIDKKEETDQELFDLRKAVIYSEILNKKY